MKFIDDERLPIIVYIIVIILLIVILGINLLEFLSWEDCTCPDTDEISIVSNNEDNLSNEKVVEVKKFKVDIKGAIKKPGVYELEENSIINDVIKLAGGLKSNASTKYLNLSKKISDEMVIYVYTSYQVSKMKNPSSDECICNSEELISCDEASVIVKGDEVTDKTNDTQKDNKISINTGTLEELMTLSGIGEAKAKAIIEYRTTNGLFNNIEDIMNVSGIGEAAYNKIKDYIKL